MKVEVAGKGKGDIVRVRRGAAKENTARSMSVHENENVRRAGVEPSTSHAHSLTLYIYKHVIRTMKTEQVRVGPHLERDGAIHAAGDEDGHVQWSGIRLAALEKPRVVQT